MQWRHIDPYEYAQRPIKNITPEMIQNHYKDLLRMRVSELMTTRLDDLAKERASAIVDELIEKERLS